ncbi:MAG: DUF3604 domain-containing protein [Pseudomonadota bacterium]
MKHISKTRLALLFVCSFITFSSQADQPKQLLWGDTHLHTSYSFDAFLNQNQSADPDTAYRWAKGQPVIHPYNRARVQIETPLDFLVVSDHAELMGVIRAIDNETAELGDVGFFADIKRRISTYFLLDAIENETGKDIFVGILPKAPADPRGDPVQDSANVLPLDPFGDTTKTESTAWYEIVDAADRHNEPGKFTSLIGWEWSSIPTGANLHRVVVSPDGGEKAKSYIPYGSDQSQYPEDLWNWLAETSEQSGARFVAIPHNSNISKGYMFAETTLRGQPITSAYARQRMLWEPVVEMTQIKGDSETHPGLSPDDEFADFETYEYYIQQTAEDYELRKGDYARSGLMRGLEIAQEIGDNPYQFGMIGSTDSHTGLASAEEYNFWGKMAKDSTPETKRLGMIRDGKTSADGWDRAAQGLAAVWAEENTRDSIFAAFQRKEVYATTGPRIAVQMFGGWEFAEDDAQATDFASTGYSKGVPMGGDLVAAPAADSQPQFLIRATKDPLSANLDRIQVVKGWVDSAGKSHERIYNVAWSEGRELVADGSLPAVGNTVDLEIPSYENSIGAPELLALWADPDFDASQRAFYYARVMEIPTPRHSLFDAISLQEKTRAEVPDTIQERAYTSPIWYTP